jgi:hypothetical protein
MELTILFSLIRPLENLSVTKEYFWMGRGRHFNTAQSPVPDVHHFPLRRSNHLPRTLPPSNPLFSRPSRRHPDISTNRNHFAHLGPPILRPPRLTLVYLAIDTLTFCHGRHQDRAGQMYGQSSHVGAFTKDAIGRHKVDVPVECVGRANQRSTDIYYCERNGSGYSWGEMDCQDTCFTLKWGYEWNPHRRGHYETGSVPRVPSQKTSYVNLTKTTPSSRRGVLYVGRARREEEA